MGNPGQAEIQRGHQELNQWLVEYLSSRPGFSILLKVVEDRFFAAPASPKSDWHGCFEGGLAYHTWQVMSIMLKLRETLPQASQVPIDSCVLVAFSHDLGKVGNLDNPYYYPQDNDWRRKNLKEMYTINFNLEPAMDVPLRSVWWLQNFQVPFNEDELQAIVAHENYEDKRYMFGATSLCWLLRYADVWAALVLGI